MASCVKNICTKNYQNLITGFQVTVKTSGMFLGHSVLGDKEVHKICWWISCH